MPSSDQNAWCDPPTAEQDISFEPIPIGGNNVTINNNYEIMAPLPTTVIDNDDDDDPTNISAEIIDLLEDTNPLEQIPTTDSGALRPSEPSRSSFLPGAGGLANKIQNHVVFKEILLLMDDADGLQPHILPENWTDFHYNCYYGELDKRTQTRDRRRAPCVYFKDYALGADGKDRRKDAFKKNIKGATKILSDKYDDMIEHDSKSGIDLMDGSESIHSIASRIYKAWIDADDKVQETRNEKKMEKKKVHEKIKRAESNLNCLPAGYGVKAPPGAPSSCSKGLHMLAKNPTSSSRDKGGTKRKSTPSRDKSAKRTKKSRKLRKSSMPVMSGDSCGSSSPPISSSDEDDGTTAKAAARSRFATDAKNAELCAKNSHPIDLTDNAKEARHFDAVQNMDSVFLDLSNGSEVLAAQFDRLAQSVEESRTTRVLKEQGMAISNMKELLGCEKILEGMDSTPRKMTVVKKSIDSLTTLQRNLDEELREEIDKKKEAKANQRKEAEEKKMNSVKKSREMKKDSSAKKEYTTEKEVGANKLGTSQNIHHTEDTEDTEDMEIVGETNNQAVGEEC